MNKGSEGKGWQAMEPVASDKSWDWFMPQDVARSFNTEILVELRACFTIIVSRVQSDEARPTVKKESYDRSHRMGMASFGDRVPSGKVDAGNQRAVLEHGWTRLSISSLIWLTIQSL